MGYRGPMRLCKGEPIIPETYCAGEAKITHQSRILNIQPVGTHAPVRIRRLV
jgi:hypothetical protein